MYPYEWTLETDSRGSSRYLPSPPHWQLGMRLRIQRPNTEVLSKQARQSVLYLDNEHQCKTCVFSVKVFARCYA